MSRHNERVVQPCRTPDSLTIVDGGHETAESRLVAARIVGWPSARHAAGTGDRQGASRVTDHGGEGRRVAGLGGAGAGPLAGIRVLEFGSLLAGPLCAR